MGSVEVFFFLSALRCMHACVRACVLGTQLEKKEKKRKKRDKNNELKRGGKGDLLICGYFVLFRLIRFGWGGEGPTRCGWRHY